MKEVVISKGFGAGWSTWNDEVPGLAQFLAEHPGLVAHVKEGLPCVAEGELVPELSGMAIEAREKFDLDSDWEPYIGGLRDVKDLRVVNVDDLYRITEYDGNEDYECRDTADWWVA